jgi:hypothetical protein
MQIIHTVTANPLKLNKYEDVCVLVRSGSCAKINLLTSDLYKLFVYFDNVLFSLPDSLQKKQPTVFLHYQ